MLWKDWHADAAQSTGIQKNVETFRVTIDNNDRLRAFYDDQAPYYQVMRAASVKALAPAQIAGESNADGSSAS